MADIDLIIQFLDKYLTDNGLRDIGAVEANELLEIEGLLNDRDERPGLPLRNILRDGKIPHAYQTGGKYSEWIIPHSSKGPARKTNYPGANQNTGNHSNSSGSSDTLITSREIIEDQFYRARIKYKPDKIEAVFIIDAPPEDFERYFYHEDFITDEYLFISIIEAIDPNINIVELHKENIDIKKDLLTGLKKVGLYMLEVSDVPLSLLKENLSDRIPIILEKLENNIEITTPIVLIKEQVYGILYDTLKENGYVNVVPVIVPYSDHISQDVYQQQMTEAIDFLKIL